VSSRFTLLLLLLLLSLPIFYATPLFSFCLTTLLFRYLSTKVPLPSRFEWDIINPTPVGPLDQIVCPNFEVWELGTWFINVQSTIPTSYDILIRKEKKPERKQLEETKKCPGPTDNDHYCITDGETLYVTFFFSSCSPSLSSFLFSLLTIFPLRVGVDSSLGVYYATKCQPVAFSLTSLKGDYDIYMSFSDPLTEDGSYDLVGYLFGDDRMTVSLPAYYLSSIPFLIMQTNLIFRFKLALDLSF
jgi:hypothetical protein